MFRLLHIGENLFNKSIFGKKKKSLIQSFVNIRFINKQKGKRMAMHISTIHIFWLNVYVRENV